MKQRNRGSGAKEWARGAKAVQNIAKETWLREFASILQRVNHGWAFMIEIGKDMVRQGEGRCVAAYFRMPRTGGGIGEGGAGMAIKETPSAKLRKQRF